MAASVVELLDDEVVDELESPPAELPPLLLPQAAAPIMRVAAATAESAIRVFIRVLLGVVDWVVLRVVPVVLVLVVLAVLVVLVRAVVGSGDLHDDGVPSGGPVGPDPGEL